MRQRALLILLGVLAVAGCGEQSSGRYGTIGLNSLGSAAFGSGSKGPAAAILLPLTGPRSGVGQVLLQSARLALQDNGPPLDVLDTAGTTAGAVTAAQTAIANGDGVILGPLTSAETASVAPIARNGRVPVIAFTNDASQSQPGVWPLGVSADQQVRRLVVTAQAQGKTQFAAMLPDNDFGRAMRAALAKAIAADGLPPPSIVMHGPGMGAITSATRDVSGYADRRGPIDEKVKAARALGTAEGRREAQDLVKTTIPPPSFDVLLLADVGDALQEIAALLPYYDVDRSRVQLIGPALWADPASASGAVRGAWYAAPDSTTRSNLERDYAAKYGSAPPPLADLAYDAASIAKLILGSGSGSDVITQPGGFTGVDGWFQLLPDGQVKRGLAVFRIERSAPEMIDPAPQSAGAPGS